jgi:hypothetical protein
MQHPVRYMHIFHIPFQSLSYRVHCIQAHLFQKLSITLCKCTVHILVGVLGNGQEFARVPFFVQRFIFYETNANDDTSQKLVNQRYFSMLASSSLPQHILDIVLKVSPLNKPPFAKITDSWRRLGRNIIC